MLKLPRIILWNGFETASKALCSRCMELDRFWLEDLEDCHDAQVMQHNLSFLQPRWLSQLCT